MQSCPTQLIGLSNDWTVLSNKIDAMTPQGNIKAAGITIHTVQVDTSGDPISTLLQNCASPEDAIPKGPKFFLLTSADQIVTTFQAIGANLTKLRVVK